jgi:hypothetical protein
MTIITGRELELLIGLQTNWGNLYSREVARLLNEHEPKCAVDPSPTHHPLVRALMPMALMHPSNATLEMNIEDVVPLDR